MKGIPPKLFNKQVQEIDRISKKYPILDESLKKYGLSLRSSVINGVANTKREGGKWLITYNNANFVNGKTLSKAVYNDVKRGFYMPCAKASREIYPTAHELGHILQKAIAEIEMGEGFTQVQYFTFAEECKKEIMSIAEKEGLTKSGHLSKYARKNPRDFFAECFANSQCGKPNAYGNAIVEYLERKGYGK